MGAAAVRTTSSSVPCPDHRPHPASRMGQRRGSARREGQAELLGLEEDSRCGAQPPVCIHRAARRAREAAAGLTREGGRGGGFPRVSPGARTAGALRQGDSIGCGWRPQSPWRARQRRPRARGEALRLAAVALFAGRGPDGVWVSETRALRDPSRAELTATACPGCRPRARGGGPAPAALPRTELTGRGLRATGLGPAGCAALGS